MSKEGIVQDLKERSKELREELEHIEGLLKLYGANGPSETMRRTKFTPEIPENKKSKTLTQKCKEGIRKLIDFALSYQKDHIKHNLKKMGIAVTDSTLHIALSQLRDEGEVVGYRINKANQNVFYMSKKGIDKTNANYPIKEEYRPDSINSEDVDLVEFLDDID